MHACLAIFSPNDISGLRRRKNVKFGIKVASGTGMMRALRFLEKVFNCGKIGKKQAKNRPKQFFHSQGGAT